MQITEKHLLNNQEMEFYKSGSINTTSSNGSSNSCKSHNSNNNDAAYATLEYCTSSSTMSPFISAEPCPSSSSKAVVNIPIDDLIIPSSGESMSWSSNLYSSHNKNILKRKRRSSFIADDPELGFDVPIAKRRQRVSSFYQSEVGSVVSSVYPSPVDELINEIDTRSTSDCSPTVTEYDVGDGDIPDSPNSLKAEESDDVVSPTSSSVSSVTSYINSHGFTTDNVIQHSGERTPGQNIVSNNITSKSSVKSFEDYLSPHCLTPADEFETPRMCPLPALAWANAQDVWLLMCKKDEHAACFRHASMLKNHPGLQPRMRAILLDWLIEVCEVYKLHRETYYLAVDYLDRYLSSQKKVQKTHLQLIGITCLFIAAKVEEIYPPKIGEFAYVTDGACQEEDILQHEILLLQALEWNISPVTAMGWLGVYMQLNVNNRTPESFYATECELNNSKNPCKRAQYSKDMRRRINCNKDTFLQPSNDGSDTEINNGFIYPQFSGMEFVKTAQLLDLCSLDVGMGNFPYSIIAAAAISYTFNRETALKCSGLDWNAIGPCAHWMHPFFQVICEESVHLHLLEQNEQLSSKFGLGHLCPNILTDDSHIIQTHTTTMTMFDRACLLHQQKYLTSKIKQEASPATGLVCPEGLLTPPASSRKPIEVVEEEIDKNKSKNGSIILKV